MDIFTLIETDLALGEQVVRGHMTQAERERMVGRMAKVMPSQGTATAERADWEDDVYTVALVADKAAKVPNPFYQTAEDLTAKYGDMVQGERYWLNEKGEKRYPDFAEDAEQWNLVFEVLDGEKQGDWLFVYASPRYYQKKDGTWGGKLAAIYHAAMPDFDLSGGIEDDFSDLVGKPLRASVKPKANNPQYAKVTDWKPIAKGYKAPKPVAPSEPTIGDETIPF